MDITEIKVKLVREAGADRLLAFVSIAISNSIVIRDIKIIEGKNGPFVAMPSKIRSEKCPRCNAKVAVLSRYCSNCGTSLSFPQRGSREAVYCDIAHPINETARAALHSAVIAEYERTREQQG